MEGLGDPGWKGSKNMASTLVDRWAVYPESILGASQPQRRVSSRGIFKGRQELPGKDMGQGCSRERGQSM